MIFCEDWITPKFNGEPFYDKPVFYKSTTTSRGGPGPFQGPSSYPQLRWSSLIGWWPLPDSRSGLMLLSVKEISR
jgi:hypothetical protein